MLCASIRATVSLAMAGFPVWSVNHLYGPFPTTYTWGYYRSDVSCLFGKWLDTAHVGRLHAWARGVTSANACQALRTRAGFGIHTSAAWLGLRSCFHARFKDPREPPRARTTDMVKDAGTRLTNVVLWDLAILAFGQQTSPNSTRTGIGMRLWAYLAQFSDPDGPLRLGSRPPHVATERAITWYTDGLGQRLTIWYTAQPFTAQYALRPYALQPILRGCKVFSSHESKELRIQQNLTGLPAPYRQAALALGNWVLADEGATDRAYRAREEGVYELSRCSGGPRVAAVAEAERGDAAWGIGCAASGPLLAVRLTRGARASYTAPLAAPPHVAGGLR